jgi:hypothetical protein
MVRELFKRQKNSSDDAKSILKILPYDVIKIILSYVPVRQVPNCLETCKTFNSYFNSQECIDSFQRIYDVRVDKLEPKSCYRYFTFYENINSFDFSVIRGSAFLRSLDVETEVIVQGLKEMLKNVNAMTLIHFGEYRTSEILLIFSLLFAALYPKGKVALDDGTIGKRDKRLSKSVAWMQLESLARDLLGINHVVTRSLKKRNMYKRVCIVNHRDLLDNYDRIVVENTSSMMCYTYIKYNKRITGSYKSFDQSLSFFDITSYGDWILEDYQDEDGDDDTRIHFIKSKEKLDYEALFHNASESCFHVDTFDLQDKFKA